VAHVQSQPPVELGQIVLVQFLSVTTVEKYSARAGHEASYVCDLSLESLDWEAPPKPALIVKVEWDNRKCLYSFTAVAIGRRRGEEEISHREAFQSLVPT
jgi:hypothetical protein